MSPVLRRLPTRQAGFPRVSGDEPAISLLREDRTTFSPRERG